MTYRRNVLTSVLTLTVAIGALHCGDDDAAIAPAPSAGGKAGAAGKAGGAGTSVAGAAGKAGTGGGSAGTGGSGAGTGGSGAGTGGSSAGTGGSSAGTGGSSAGTGGSSAGTGGSSAGAAGTAQAGSGGTNNQGGGGNGQAGTTQGGAGGTDAAGAGGEAGAGGAVEAPDFSIALNPASVKIPRGSGSSVNVNITKLAGFDGAVTVEVVGLPAGVTAPNVVAAATDSAAGLTISASAGAAIGAAGGVKVRATSGSIVHELDLALEIVAPAATITNVERLAATTDTVLAYKQFRQGYETLRIRVSGADLGTPVLADVKLGNIVAKTITNGNGNFIAAFDVPHGEPKGLHDLTLTKAGGVATSPGVADITHITSSASAPNLADISGRGTPESPFKTLTRANGVSGTNDTIVLQPGAYQTGETFPITLAEGVTLTGTVSGINYQTTLTATAAGPCLASATGGAINDLQLATCTIAKSGPGKLTISRVRSDNAQTAVTVTGGEAAFVCPILGGPTCGLRDATTGINVSAGATVSGNLRVVNAVTNGLVLAGTANLVNPAFTNSGSNASIVLTGAAKLTANRVSITQIPRSGIRAGGTSTVTIDDASLSSTTGGTPQSIRALVQVNDTAVVDLKKITAKISPATSNMDFLQVDGGTTVTVGPGTIAGADGQLVNGRTGGTAAVTFTGVAVSEFNTGAIALVPTFTGTVTLGTGTVLTKVGTAIAPMMQDARTATTAGITVAAGVTFDGFLVPAGSKTKASPVLKAGLVSVWNITGNGSILFQ